MWVHLGGYYWQRASFDAVVVVAALLGSVAAAPELNRLRPRHIVTGILMAAAVTVFGIMLARSVHKAATHIEQRTIRLEMSGPQ